jgi:hypothetical protein
MPHKWTGTFASAMNSSMKPRAMSGASERSALVMEAGGPVGLVAATEVVVDTTGSFGVVRVRVSVYSVREKA